MALWVITGPPAGGKTTWVRQHARPGDIVIDLDAIAGALTAGPPTHQHAKPVLRCAQRARSVAIDEALKHTHRCDVYVIHMQPEPRHLARYAQHGAQVVTVDPGREVVEQRARDERPPGTLAVVARWYAKRPAPASVTPSDSDRPRAVHSRSW
ncbi:MAG TPA: AAA family ATPase [Thermopolyspora sp.]